MSTVISKPAAEPTTVRPGWNACKRLLVVDDHPAMRAGLRDLLGDEPDFEVIAVTDSAEAAIAVAEQESIDVAVVDYQLGTGRNGLWLSRKLKRLPTAPAVLIYSAYTDGVLAAAAVVAEADAIVSKASLGSELCDAVRSVAAGLLHLPPVPPALAGTLRSRLDDQEQAIFGMLLAGIEPAEVAATLDLPAAGLESRLWAMLRRLEGRSVDTSPRSNVTR
jgi:DNA-binding NarL/FixJ family response regulator